MPLDRGPLDILTGARGRPDGIIPGEFFGRTPGGSSGGSGLAAGLLGLLNALLITLAVGLAVGFFVLRHLFSAVLKLIFSRS